MNNSVRVCCYHFISCRRTSVFGEVQNSSPKFPAGSLQACERRGESRVEQNGKEKEVQALSRHSFLICSKGQTGAKHWQLHSGNLSIKKEDCLLECEWNIASGRALQESSVERWVGQDLSHTA